MAGLFEILGYRATTARYASILDGAGAAKGARNRWNTAGQFVTYAASSRALALLELRVHSPVGPPNNAVISVIRLALPEVQVRRIKPADLPEGWRDPCDIGHCQIRGATWYTAYPDERLLVVPSVIVPAEDMFVIRAGIAEATVVEVEPIDIDPRLWDSERLDRGLVYTLVPSS